MRMRKRPNLGPRMEKCSELLVDAPESFKGRWKETFSEAKFLYLELGCGKGRFTVGTAANESDALLLALEKVPDAMIIAMERTMELDLKNIRFIDDDAAKLSLMFAYAELDRIFINFCDPWPKSRDAKFRLTAPGFLRSYCDLLPIGGQIHFKTDNTPLFLWSIRQLEDEGWQLSEITDDLHAPGAPETVLTDYEAKFMESGLKINRLVAQRSADTKGSAAGAVPRLRDAALIDARGYMPETAAGKDRCK